MKLCLACGKEYNTAEWCCPSCGARPKKMDGYLSFAPEKAFADVGFKAEYYERLVELESRNFWFRARNKLIVWALNKYFPLARTFLEVGCGTGYVLSGIRTIRPELKLYGSELHGAGLEIARGRVFGADFFQMDARNMPFSEEFDVVGTFDVLEHIDDDEMALRQIHRAVVKGGGILITVPQHKFLWSYQDEYGCHMRRYQAKELKEKVEKAGFTVISIMSFVSLLLPFMIFSRIVNQRPEKVDALAELSLPPFVNYFFEKCLDAERVFLKAGLRFPAGGSLLAVAKKQV